MAAWKLWFRLCILWIVSDASGVPGEAPRPFLVRVTPNPFQSTAAFSFDLDDEGPVTLTLFDVTGAHIRTIHAGSFPLA